MCIRDREQIVALCKRRGIIFQSSEIYGGVRGFWDYGPLGTELKRNVRDAWYRDMVTMHDDITAPEGAPSVFSMVGIETSIVMHPRVWKSSGHYDLFHDMMIDCKETKKRYRHDHIVGEWVKKNADAPDTDAVFVTTVESDNYREFLTPRALKFFGLRNKHSEQLVWLGSAESLTSLPSTERVLAPEAKELNTLTEPREFNLMLKTTLGALGGEDDAAFLRPETAQGMFVNFKNVLDSSRVKFPFGIAQIGKSFRNEITPRNFIFRSREFEQMEMEFFCHPDDSPAWYQYWRDRRYKWLSLIHI